jgi:hypothetical protein
MHLNYYTVIIFLARNGRTRAVKFRPKISGDFFSIWAKFPQFSKFFGWAMDEIRPKLGEIRQIFLRANLNCADSPISNKFRKKNNYCVVSSIDSCFKHYPEILKKNHDVL